METLAGVRKPSRIYAALAGWQAGMLAVLGMLAAIGVVSAWFQRSFWTPCNVMATTFYGARALGRGLSWSCVSGIALYLILYSLLGAAFAAVMRPGSSRLRLALIGILTGVAWFYLWFGLLWPHLNPLVSLYTHDRPMLWGHMLYGALLSRFPEFGERLRKP
jgi:hypothetical protein